MGPGLGQPQSALARPMVHAFVVAGPGPRAMTLVLWTLSYVLWTCPMSYAVPCPMPYVLCPSLNKWYECKLPRHSDLMESATCDSGHWRVRG